MKIKMEKLLLALFGIAFLSVLTDAQDIGRMRRLMLLRQRELALRRAAFPFGMRGIGGPGIPPPVAARLALIQRQRALSSPFFPSPLGPLGTPFSPFAPTAVFGPGGPFGSPFSLPGPTDMGRFDLSTLGFPAGATFGGPDGLPVVDTDGLTTVGGGGITTIGSGGPTGAAGQQGGSGNIFGQQPTQAEEFLETNRGTVEARSESNTDGREPGQPPMPGFRTQTADSSSSRFERQRMQRRQDGPQSGGRQASPQMSGESISPPFPPPRSQPAPPRGPLQLEELIFPPPQPILVPLDPRRVPSRPTRRRGRFEEQNQRRNRRMQRQRRGRGRGRRSRGPRVFPNVPDVVQIPSVTPTAQGQPGGGQTGLTQAGAGQMGGQTNVQTGGQTGGQIGGQVGGPVTGPMGAPIGGTMGGSFSGTMGGPMGGPVSGPMGAPMGGTMGGSFSGTMGGPMGGPVSGPLGGTMGGTMGGPMGGPISGPIGATMGGTMRGPMGGPISGPMGGRFGGTMGGPMGRPVSGPIRGPMGGTMRGPFSGPMGRTMGGTMRGPMGGPMSGPIGGPMGGPFSGPIGGSMGPPMGGPVSGQNTGSVGVQMGGPMRGPVSGPMGGAMGGPTRGGPGSGSFGGQMTGQSASFGQPSTGQFSTGFQPQGGQGGSAIFPSQAAQGPIIRQPGPGFTSDSSFSTSSPFSGSTSVVPGFPNGPALQFPGGAQFGQSDPFIFPTGGFSPEALSTATGFQGFPAGGSFGERFTGATVGGQGFRPATFGPSFDATPTGQTTGQTSGGAESQSQIAPNFGFVGPSDNAAGPAFNTGTQSTQNFNLQFQPLQPGQQVPQIPEQQPNQGQMGIGTSVQANTGLNSGFSSQGNIGLNSGFSSQGNTGLNQGSMQFGGSGQSSSGSTQNGLQFSGSSQTGIQTGGTDQNSKFMTSGSTTVVETNPESGSILSASKSQSSDNAANTITERVVETVPPGGNAEGSTEFRLVEVGNILGDKGFVNSGAISESAAVAIETTTGQQGSAFQPAGDITTAFRSFEAVDGSQNVVDLSLEPTATMTTEGSTVSKTDTTGSTTVTNTTETRTVMSVQDSPFARSINQDFSFFMAENNEAPNEMPPITFTAPEPPRLAPGLGSEGTQILTFDVQGTGNTGGDMSNTSQPGLSFSTNSITTTSDKTVTGPVQPDTPVVAGETAAGGSV